MQDLEMLLEDFIAKLVGDKLKRELVEDGKVTITQHNRARLLKYYPRPPCTPSFCQIEYASPTTNTFLTSLTSNSYH